MSATLVATVSPTTHGFPPARLADALVGGVVALVFSQLLFPVHPVKVVQEAAEDVIAELADTLCRVAQALDERNLESAEEALAKAMRIGSEWSGFEQALDVGREAARYAPPRRRHGGRFSRYRDSGLSLGLLVRDVHVLAPGRGAHPLTRRAGPATADRRGQGSRVCRPRTRPPSRTQDDEDRQVESLALRAAHASTEAVGADDELSLSVLLAYTQAASADVLRALGMDRAPAHERVGAAARAAAR